MRPISYSPCNRLYDRAKNRIVSHQSRDLRESKNMVKLGGTNTWLLVAAATLLQLHLLAASIGAVNAIQLQLKDQMEGPCRASFTGGSLDLSPLDSVNKTKKPKFYQFAQVSIGGSYLRYYLTYNPCSGFACKLDQAAALCATDIYGFGGAYDIASQSGGAFSEVNGTLQIRYNNSDQTRNFFTVVTLVCSPSSDNDTLTDVQMSDANELTFRLVSKHCCLVAPIFPGGWSPGDYMVLTFFLALFLYFVSFLAINGLIRKQSGLDLLPHRHAWIYVGLLIKDGCVFTFAAIRQKIIVRRGYMEI